MKIQLMDYAGEFAPGTTVLEVIRQLAPEWLPKTLGCFCGGLSLELTHPLSSDCTLFPITFQNEEGRRIYERSLRFVMLLGVRAVFPHAKVRIEHSIGYGVYLRLIDHQLSVDFQHHALFHIV